MQLTAPLLLQVRVPAQTATHRQDAMLGRHNSCSPAAVFRAPMLNLSYKPLHGKKLVFKARHRCSPVIVKQFWPAVTVLYCNGNGTHLCDQFADAPISRAGGALNSSAFSMPPSSLIRKKPAGTALVLQEMRAICRIQFRCRRKA